MNHSTACGDVNSYRKPLKSLELLATKLNHKIQWLLGVKSTSINIGVKDGKSMYSILKVHGSDLLSQRWLRHLFSEKMSKMSHNYGGVGWIRQVLAHQKQGPRATIGAAPRALCYDGSEEPSPGPATYASETKYKAPVLQVCWGLEGRKNVDVLDDFWDVFDGFMIGKHVVL